MSEQIIVKGGKILYKLYQGKSLMHATYDKKEALIMRDAGNKTSAEKWVITEVVKS